MSSPRGLEEGGMVGSRVEVLVLRMVGLRVDVVLAGAAIGAEVVEYCDEAERKGM